MIHHQPVFKKFLIENFLHEEDEVILDATLGEGGHAQAFLEKGKKVIAFERDQHILKKAKERLSEINGFQNCIFHHDNFNNIANLLGSQPIIDLALFDLGISKFHYLEGGRGFTFQNEETLNMSLDDNYLDNAYHLINNLEENELADLFYHLGEETLSRACAKTIVYTRQQQPITTTTHLAELIKKVYHRKQIKTQIHPATKVFQALRIKVNDELSHITPGVNAAINLLKPGGRVCVIAYHSLEDRLIKNIFSKKISPKKNYNKYREEVNSGNLFSLYQKKIIRPDKEEITENPSSRSACLRILCKKR